MDDPSDDAMKLTAYLDGETTPAEREALSARLAAEPALRARLAELRRGQIVLQSRIMASLGEAPAAAMAARLRSATQRPASRGPWWGGALAAGLALLAFAAGWSVERLSGPPRAAEAEDWRRTVAEYMSLYTASSFPTQEPTTLESQLRALSQSLGVDLELSSLRLGSLAPRSALGLQFKGDPLAQIGYVADGKPIAFCIIRDGEPDSEPRSTKMEGFNVISWASQGRGYMVVSSLDPDQLGTFARQLRR